MPHRPSRSSLAHAGLAVSAGLLVAASMPPWGWWPLAFPGLALWEWLLAGQRGAVRWRRTWLFSLGWLAPATAWMWFLTEPGYVVAMAVFAALHASATLLIPSGPDDRWRWLALPAALTAAEALRFCFPFGGVPLATLAISQVAGPLAGLARVGGAVLMTFATALIGTNLRRVVVHVRSVLRRDDFALRHLGAPAAAVAAVPLLLFTGVVAPHGEDTGRTATVALVQGGGRQGIRAIYTDPRLVLDRHLAAVSTLDGPIDLVVMPENVIDVVDFASSEQRFEVAEQAARLGAPILVGITEDSEDHSQFLNAQVEINPDGTIGGRYEKVRRVPFGEFMPMRDLLDALGAPTDVVPRDAAPGSGPAIIDTPIGRVGVVISWEVFFGGRAREGVKLGAELIVNPTNGSSYTGTILQSQQVASSRLRALETGRWVAQVSPTGFSAFISPNGTVYDRTAQREMATRVRTVELRTGETWYVRLGDKPFVALVLILWSLPIMVPFFRRSRRRYAAASDGHGGRHLEASEGPEGVGADGPSP